MIITKLVMRNFRVFRGEHTLDLEPESQKGKPLILIGGLNGSGKTSILTAIRLALYGAQAFDDVFTKQAYVERLSSLIHNGKPDGLEDFTHSFVEISFKLQIDGEHILYRARRSWSKGKGDTLVIYENDSEMLGKTPELLQGFLNELIPVGVGDLFFFDGEKIATLAEDETGSILRIAMQRLLGLDVVTRLKNDLNVYLKNDARRKLSGKVQEQLDDLEKKKNELIQLAHEKRNKTIEFLNGIEANINGLRKYEALLSSLGKNFADSKFSEQAKLKVLEARKSHIEKQLLNTLDGYYPLTLAPNTFKKLFDQIELEKKIIQAKAFYAGLEDFLEKLKSELAIRSSTTLKIATETIQDKLDDFLSQQPKGEILLDVSERESNILHHAFYSISARQKEEKDDLCSEMNTVENAILGARGNISRVPEEEQLSSTFNTIREYDNAIRSAVEEFKKLNEEAKNALSEALDCVREQQKFHDMIKNKVNLDNATESAISMLPLLDKYAHKLTEKRIAEVEREFSEIYKHLARKDELRLQAIINVKTFNVDLQDERGKVIDRNLLSAGEKQIYAVTMLEALGKVSGKLLPVIIDTPLGRLDSHHRDKLVENYIPEASHQVIILSTDTEIDERYYRYYLGECISKSYEICYSHLSQSSIIKNGYFWKDKKNEGVN
ncbi:DNA sulfur modification protein DndD [Salmonella enterica]|uniref:DNA sulfur modification protein DndD n=1 Tax=Salmonella enterica TaxID=28901 RepID=A0A5U2ETQ6_SALER|nr:DNA sulfur modification protein DndD [Salmonella enterica]ECW2407403.1 DNA sulfur modification protein DndD [Salmonella enterica]EJT3365997.1 DNA sulfur modification protein DndD [Salmonella enterica]